MGTIRLGALQVDPSRNLIANDAASWSIEPKIMDLLVLLAAHPGEVLSREALIDQVWKVEYGADESLTRAVSLLRKTFREAGETAELIETVPKRGYRLTVTPEAGLAGNTAPVASSSEAMSLQGPVTVSATPEPASVKTTLPHQADKTGRRRLVPIVALASVLLVLAAVVVGVSTRWGAPKREASIAVLPFAIEVTDSERAYLGRVLSGEIIDILSQLKGMEVIARNSSFTFSPEADILEVGQKLDVAHVLSGALREEGRNIHVLVTLADARTGRVIWTRNDTAPFAPQHVPSLQKRIAEQVAGAMSIAFNLPASARLTGGSTTNLEAYDNYLRGLDYWWYGGAGPDELVDTFARATELDRNYAEAWAGQAFSTARMSLFQSTPEKAVAQQKEAYAMAERAVNLAPGLSVTQASYGALSTTQKKWEQAEIATLKALEISRGELPLMHRAMLLVRVGRASEADDVSNELDAADPLIKPAGLRLMGVYIAAGRNDELLEIAGRDGWLKSKSASVQMNGLIARIISRQPPDAIRDSLQSLARQPDLALAEFATDMLAAFDDPETARAVLRAAYEDPAFQHVAKWEVIPFLAAWFGDDDLVLRVWRDELPVNNMRTIYLWSDTFAGARARPEFKQLVRDLGFVDYWRAHRWADRCRPLAGDDFECS